MKNRNSHHGEVFYRASSTYIQASNHDIKDQKPTLKGTNIPKPKKNYRKIKKLIKIEKSQNYVQKGI